MDPLSITTTYDSLAQVALNVFRNSWSTRRTSYYNELNKSVDELSVSITRIEATLLEKLKAAGSSEEERPYGRMQRSHIVGERRFPCPIISKDEIKNSSAGQDSKYRAIKMRSKPLLDKVKSISGATLEAEGIFPRQSPARTLQDSFRTGKKHISNQVLGERHFASETIQTLETELTQHAQKDFTPDRQLQRHHIHLIALGSTIGTGLFFPLATTSGPLPLLMALTLIALIAWPVMYCLGELVAACPMSIKDSWIHDVILYQKLLQFMILLGAVYSIPQIMSVVARIGFLLDEESGYVFSLSCIAFGIGLHYTPNILKTISWTISGIQSLIQTCIEWCTNSLLGHRSSRSRSHAGRAFILSLLLWTTPVTATATSLETSTYPSHSPFLVALSIESGKLVSLFTTPTPPFPRSFPAPTLLLALLLTTSLLTILYTRLAHNNNTSTKYLLCTSVCLSLLLGSVSAVDIPDLVFRYLFPGVSAALMISALNDLLQQQNKVVEQESIVDIDIDIDVEGGNIKHLDAAEEKRRSMLH